MQYWFQEVDECIVLPQLSPQEEFDDFMKQLQHISSELQKKQGNKNNKSKESMYFTSKGKSKCQICQRNISRNNNIVKLKCQHKYHKNCFNGLQECCIKCPLCRSPTK